MGRTYGRLQAVLTPPKGHLSQPLLHDRPSIDLLTDPECNIEQQSGTHSYGLMLTDLQRCGVEDCSEGGKRHLCVTIRFPALFGIQLPEDEVATIRCDPQDPTAAKVQAVNVGTSRHFSKEREMVTFEGGGQSFTCEIALYRRDPATNFFTSKVDDSTELELGEEVQLWSVVQANDGWEYSQLVEVTVHRSNADLSSARGSALLVRANGCANPSYAAVAPSHPEQSPKNRLINIFPFRVFLFQDMTPGESVVVTAKVVGCVDAIDCQTPSSCEGASGRKRREIREGSNITHLTPPPLARHPRLPSSTNSTANLVRSLNIRIRRPGSSVTQQKLGLNIPECQLYLLITVTIAVIMFLSTIIFVTVLVCKKKCREQKEKELSRSTASHPVQVLGTQITKQQQPKLLIDQMDDRSSLSTVSSSDCESEASGDVAWFPPPQMLIPHTVRQRKRMLNNELLKTFQSEDVDHLTLSSCPPLLNYYGYMVVPRKPSAASSSSSSSGQKKNSDTSRNNENKYGTNSSHQANNRPKTQKQKYVRRKRKNESGSSRSKSSDRSDEVGNHHTIITVPPPPPPCETLPRTRPRHGQSENIYEMPCDNRSVVMV